MQETSKGTLIGHLIGKRSKIGNILARADKIVTLNQYVKRLLSKDLADNCQIANYNEGILIILVNSPARAMQLRFLVPQLLEQLQTTYKWDSLKNIKLQVTMDYQRTVEAPSLREEEKALHYLSTSNAEQLTLLANNIENIMLKKALLKLSLHGTNA